MKMYLLAYSLIASASLAFASPPFVYTGGATPVAVLDIHNTTTSYGDWRVEKLYEYDSASDIAASDYCQSNDCPTQLADLPGSNLYFSSGDAEITFTSHTLTGFKSAVVTLKMYASENNFMSIFSGSTQSVGTWRGCQAKLVTEKEDDGFPEVCWYENVQYTPMNETDEITVRLMLNYENVFLLLETLQIELYDVEVAGPVNCLAWPIEDTCADGAVTRSPPSWSAAPPFVYTGGASPVATLDMKTDTRGWVFNDEAIYATAADFADSSYCHENKCPDGIANLTGTDLYLFTGENNAVLYAGIVSDSVKSALMYVTYYASENNVAQIDIDGGYDQRQCNAKELGGYDDEGFPLVCWYENIQYTPMSGMSVVTFDASVGIPETSDAFLIVESIRVELYDVYTVLSTENCWSWPVEGTCVETAVPRTRPPKTTAKTRPSSATTKTAITAETQAPTEADVTTETHVPTKGGITTSGIQSPSTTTTTTVQTTSTPLQTTTQTTESTTGHGSNAHIDAPVNAFIISVIAIIAFILNQ